MDSAATNPSPFSNLAGRPRLAVPLLEYPHASRTNTARIRVARFGRGIRVRSVNGARAQLECVGAIAPATQQPVRMNGDERDCSCGEVQAESVSIPVIGHQGRDSIMELMDAIFKRRSVRDYRTDPVPQETITRLIEAAIHAPSAINQQPWSFSVVRDPRLLDRMSHDAKAHMVNVRPAALPAHLYESLASPDFHVFYHAPVLIVISAIERGPWIAEDCALAAENLMLAAHGMGLGSCWIGLAQAWLDTPKGKETLGVPVSHVVVAPIIVGVPNTTPPTVPRKDPEIRWVG